MSRCLVWAFTFCLLISVLGCGRSEDQNDLAVIPTLTPTEPNLNAHESATREQSKSIGYTTPTMALHRASLIAQQKLYEVEQGAYGYKPMPKFENWTVEQVPDQEAIDIKWQIRWKGDSTHYNIWRMHTEGWVLMHTKPASCEFDCTYTWLDEGVKPNRVYYYKLEDTDSSDEITLLVHSTEGMAVSTTSEKSDLLLEPIIMPMRR